MTPTEPAAEIDRRFSDPSAEPPAWSEIQTLLEQAEIFWLSTVRKDGRPHVTPLPAMWLDGALHFCTGTEEQKARNLTLNSDCILTTGCNAFRTGIDVVVEGRAERVTDAALLRRLVAMWLFKLDWHFDVVEGGFRDPGLDDPGVQAIVFALRPSKVLAFTKGEPFGQTRYRFG